jgi:putative membrane protein
MIRLLARLFLNLLANALGLIVAAAVLDKMDLTTSGFLIALAIFTVTETLAGPLITKIALQSAPALLGGIALVVTLVGLIVTDLVSDGLTLSGLGTWIAATVIVWIAALLANVILPLFILKEHLSDDGGKKGGGAAAKVYGN